MGVTSKIMDDLWEQIQSGIEDAQRDFPETNPDDVAWEVVNNLTIGHSTAVRNEMRRRVGFDGLE